MGVGVPKFLGARKVTISNSMIGSNWYKKWGDQKVHSDRLNFFQFVKKKTETQKRSYRADETATVSSTLIHYHISPAGQLKLQIVFQTRR